MGACEALVTIPTGIARAVVGATGVRLIRRRWYSDPSGAVGHSIPCVLAGRSRKCAGRYTIRGRRRCPGSMKHRWWTSSPGDAAAWRSDGQLVCSWPVSCGGGTKLGVGKVGCWTVAKAHWRQSDQVPGTACRIPLHLSLIPREWRLRGPAVVCSRVWRGRWRPGGGRICHTPASHFPSDGVPPWWWEGHRPASPTWLGRKTVPPHMQRNSTSMTGAMVPLWGRGGFAVEWQQGEPGHGGPLSDSVAPRCQQAGPSFPQSSPLDPLDQLVGDRVSCRGQNEAFLGRHVGGGDYGSRILRGCRQGRPGAPGWWVGTATDDMARVGGSGMLEPVLDVSGKSSDSQKHKHKTLSEKHQKGVCKQRSPATATTYNRTTTISHRGRNKLTVGGG